VSEVLILQNVTAVQFEPARVQGGVDIAVEGSLIQQVGPGLTQKYPQAQVKPMHGRLVMPGIVCSHNHFYSGLARGIMASIKPCPDFISTLKNLWWRLDRALDEESLYYSGLVCSLEAIKSGCTAVIDHHASPNCIAGSLNTLRKGFVEAGLRGITCYETTQRNGGDAELKAGVAENVAFARQVDAAKTQGDEPYLVEAMIGAHAPFTISNQGMEWLAEAVQSTGRGLHIHVAEDRYDVSHSHDAHGQDPIERLAAHQLINARTLVAHGLYLSDADIEILNAQDAFLVHNPRSNMNNHVGYNAKLAAYRNLALGTDGIGADMFEELKFAFFKHRDAGGPMWPDSFTRFLWNGNRLLERHFGARFGKLEAGHKADLTVCDYDSPTPLVAQNIGGHLAFGMGASAVHSVMVEGRLVYENRSFPFDVAPIYAAAREAAAALWQRMDALDRTGAAP
jgi:putative selenium metabolism protein SsnA